ncbi:tyrosine-type recombinase/integrase [Dialister invisus]|uniref:tyrosine-type recombinase/integrase n=1 Tax=Dialister invisus TaxID=218538 RepID=UPI003AAFADEF
MVRLFCDTEGNPIIRNHIEKISRRIFDAMGLPNFTFHSLRHTHATLLLKKGINSKVLGNRLDHSTLFQQIMDTYGHFIPDLEMGVKNTEKDKS